MPKRDSRRALFYGRRSSDRQALSLDYQLDWALNEAQRLNLHLEGDAGDLERMQQLGLHQQRGLFLDDGITGADLKRPGLLALIQAGTTDPGISHLLVYNRDRLARPSRSTQGMDLETELRRAGLTIVFSDGIAEPLDNGEAEFSQDLLMFLAYRASGDFLKTLAERILRAHAKLAQQGYSTGGNPPYGFGRFLVDAQNQVVRELEKGEVVRREGYHVRFLPNDEDKLAVWLKILDLKHQGWGVKRIADWLNRQGIPSPATGSVRHDQGVAHRVSGRWNHNTVAGLCRNPIIVGLKLYGQRSEGEHRRLGPDGPRKLQETDHTLAGSTRLINNSPEIVISAPAGCDARYNSEKWDEIQQQMNQRAASQSGIRRARDTSACPLSTRVVDLTEGCGAVMYGITHSQRPVYKCSRYQKYGTGNCYHNSVDGEALLKFTLASIRDCVTRYGDTKRLRGLLLQRAEEEGKAGKPSIAEQELQNLTRQLDALKDQKHTVGKRMAVEKDDQRYEFLGTEFDRLGRELADLQRRQQELAASASQAPRRLSPEAEVDKALGLLNHLEGLAAHPEARKDLTPILEKLGLWIGLSFTEARKGKRAVRRLQSGMICFGGYNLPVPLHGADNCERSSDSQQNQGNSERGDPSFLLESSNVQQEGVSSTKVNRDDRT